MVKTPMLEDVHACFIAEISEITKDNDQVPLGTWQVLHPEKFSWLKKANLLTAHEMLSQEKYIKLEKAHPFVPTRVKNVKVKALAQAKNIKLGTSIDALTSASQNESVQDEVFEPDDDVGKTKSGPAPLIYDGTSTSIVGLPTRADLVRASDPKNVVTHKISESLQKGEPVLFMPTDVVEKSEYVHGIPVYKLHLFGILPNGAKTHVILDDIDVYFDVRVTSKTQKGDILADFGKYVTQIFRNENIDYQRIENHEAFPIRGFRKSKAAWKRIYFSDVRKRKTGIDALRGLGLETASDDRSSYFRMVARVYGLVLTDWMILSEYTYYRGGTHSNGQSTMHSAPKSPLCEHVFRVSVGKCMPLIDPMSSKELQDERAAAKRANPNLARDKTLVMAWDIETYSKKRLGDVPLAINEEDNVFMICMTLHWKDDPLAICKVCIVDVDTEPDKRWITVTCGTEASVVRAFAVVFRHFAPDLIAGFNDGDYDWPFIVETARQNGDLAFMFHTMSAMYRYRASTNEAVEKWNVNNGKKIKISAGDSAYVTYLKVPGCIPIDVRAMFRQLFPKAEVGKGSSLNFYLKACNLHSKADMPYHHMWKIYENRDAVKMRHVAHYCVIDAMSCQRLLVKRNVINDRREKAALAYVSLNDAIYYADGHKVCNMLIAYAIRRDILCSNIHRESTDHGKYPGAWVFHPKKGLSPDPTIASVQNLEKAREALITAEKKKDDAEIAKAVALVMEALKAYCPGRPVTGLDFSSLYPSIIMAYNLSPEKFVESADEVRALKAQNYDLHFTEFPFGGRTVRGWFVRHKNIDADQGLYPAILRDLFNKRARMKKKMAPFGMIKEQMEIVMGLVQKNPSTTFTEIFETDHADKKRLVSALAKKKTLSNGEKKELRKLKIAVGYMDDLWDKHAKDLESNFHRKYKETCFDYMAIDSKQRALKCFMNTFYGEAGNSISPFFLLQLAGGVTTAGQYNIKMVADFVLAKLFHIMYGDTDSLYVVPPEIVFQEVDKLYGLGKIQKEEYWSRMVRITMAELGTLRDEVNNYLKADNGTSFLRMAYEEVLFPVVFTGKKKYFGIPHEDEVNFRPKKLFIRGIDVVKQGQTELAKKIGYRVMWAAVSLDNSRALLTIVEDVIKDGVENGSQWIFEDFVQSASWKPHKKNMAVQRFMARMRARVSEETATNIFLLAHGKKPKKSSYSMPDAGERFRYVLVKMGALFSIKGFKAKPKKGDIMEFADVAKRRNLPIDVGQYLRSYVVGLCARFINYAEQFLPPGKGLDEKALDSKSQTAAKKYLEKFILGLQNADPETVRKRGYAYKRAWKKASRVCGQKLLEKIGPAAGMFHGAWVDWTIFLPSEDHEAVTLFAEQAEKLAHRAILARRNEFLLATCQKLGIGKSGDDLEPNPNGTSKASKLYSCAAALCSPAKRRKRPTVRELILSNLDRREAALRQRLSGLMPIIGTTALRYEASLLQVVKFWRMKEHETRKELGLFEDGDKSDKLAIDFDDKERSALKEVHKIWGELVGVFGTRTLHRSWVSHLDQLKNRRQKVATAPSGRSAIIAESARRLSPLGISAIGNGDY